MFGLFFALLMGLATPVFNNTSISGSSAAISYSAESEEDPVGGDDGSTGDDSGDETGHIPPKPPTP